LQTYYGTTGQLLGSGVAGKGFGGVVSPVADGGNAFDIAAHDTFSGGTLLRVGDNYASFNPKFVVADDGTLWSNGGLQLQSSALVTDILDEDDLTSDRDDALATQQSIKAYVDSSGGGNDSLPDIDQWVIVDKTTGSYTEDGTIQFPEDTIADAITVASGMTPTASKRVGIKLMPGHYTEDSLDLPSYVYVIGESREACVITQTGDTEIIEQTNDHAGYYSVSIERTGSSGGTTGNTGTMTITVNTPTFGQYTLDDAGGAFTSDLVGKDITISGATSPGHNGTFTVIAVNSSTQLVYATPAFESDVTETLTYTFPTFTSAVDLDGVSDIRFRDVNFSFDERPGILVHGSADCEVVFEQCVMTQTFVTSSEIGILQLYGFDVSGSGDHVVVLDDVNGEGIGARCSAGTLTVVDTRLHHLAMSGAADLFMYHSIVSCPDLPGSYGGFGYDPVTLEMGCLALGTTGQVRVDRCSFFGWKSWEFGLVEETRIATPVLFTAQPSHLSFVGCHFGNRIPGRTPPTSPYQDLDFTIAGTAEGVFRHCTYEHPVEYTIVDIGSDVVLVGPNEMYDNLRDAVRAVASRAQDGIVIKLTADYNNSGFSTYWPDGYLTILDLNGFQIDGQRLVTIDGTTDNPQVVVKNGRVTNSDLIVVSTTSNAQDWKVHFQNLEVDPTVGSSPYIRSGGSGAELIVDNVRGWVGSGTYGLWIDDVNPTVTFRNGSYIKGSSGNPAVLFSVANTKFRAARSTFIHGSSGVNNPFSATVSGVVVTLDFCRANSDPTLSPNISASAESAFNIFDNALQDFAG